MSAVMALPVPRFQMGQKVFCARWTTVGARRDCPDCKGTKKWRAISPAGLEVEMDCPRCQRDSYSDGLSLSYTRYVPFVRELTIGSVEINTARDNPISYMAIETGVGSGSVYYEEDLYSTEADAEAAMKALCAEKQADHDAQAEPMKRAVWGRMGYFEAMASAQRSELRKQFDASLKEQFDAERPENAPITPGQWCLEAHDLDSGTLSLAIRAKVGLHDSRELCSGYGHDNGPAYNVPRGEAVANFRLMAAAPDLLAALQGVLRVADRQTDEFDAARAAIAKATQP